MSTDAGAGVGSEPTVETTDWESMLETLDVAIDEASYKIENGRIRSPENEKVRIKWVRALAYAMNVRRQIANDRDLEELAERLEQIEQEQNR
jgi:hypothetical protein